MEHRLNMDNINERIKYLRSVLNITQLEFSKKIYISQSSYGGIETGERKVNDRVIQLISTKFSVSKDWLINGTGEMFIEDNVDIRIEHLIEIYKKLNRRLQDYLMEQVENLLKLNDKM